MEISVSELRVIRKGMWRMSIKEDDIKYLKQKVDSVCVLLTTQIVFLTN